MGPYTASDADWAALKKSQPSDFDGHTCFDQMTPADRLRWLEQAAEFVSIQKGAASKPIKDLPAVAEDPATYGAKL
jgi:hypothetical protein